MNKKIVVLGLGISGLGAAILAKKKGYNVFVSDKGNISEKNKKVLFNYSIDWEEGKHTVKEILNAKEVVKSPGISDQIDIIKQLNNKNIPIISDVEFAFRYTKAKIAAITGSNGKTTTTFLLGGILKNAGYNVLIAGNIGISFALSIAEKKYDYIVLELSSFQLDGIHKFRSDIAIILNITPDHLERYNGKFENYIASKFKITQNQTKKDVLIYNTDDSIVNNIQSQAKKIPISLDKKYEEGGTLDKKKIIIKLNNQTMTIHELGLQGKQNVYNSMAAAIAARIFEVKDSVIKQSMIDFKSLEHRLEHVLTVHGIDFINDSKATNINACWYALESMQKDIIWIVGGIDKGNDYANLDDLVFEKVKAIVCLGKNGQKIIKHFKGKVDVIVQAFSMNEAVNQSYSLAKKGDVVLLSPACASFDLFLNYEDRGLQFKNAVRTL